MLHVHNETICDYEQLIGNIISKIKLLIFTIIQQFKFRNAINITETNRNTTTADSFDIRGGNSSGIMLSHSCRLSIIELLKKYL